MRNSTFIRPLNSNEKQIKERHKNNFILLAASFTFIFHFEISHTESFQDSFFQSNSDSYRKSIK